MRFRASRRVSGDLSGFRSCGLECQFSLGDEIHESVMIQQIRRVTDLRFPLEASLRVEELNDEMIEEVEAVGINWFSDAVLTVHCAERCIVNTAELFG